MIKRILVSNDDGVYSEGINTLYDELSSYYKDTFVIAPDRNQSAASHSLTLENPLRIQKINKPQFIAVKGTPTDSVYLGINQLLNPKPDIVISGINHGANLGDDVIYSGTVAAATMGRNLKYSPIAISLCGTTHFKSAARYLLKILKMIEYCPMFNNQILNINVPDLEYERIKGIKVTRLGTREAANSVIVDRDIRGQFMYWVGLQGKAQDCDIGTDFWAVENGYVSITPLKVDLTSYEAIDELSNLVIHQTED